MELQEKGEHRKKSIKEVEKGVQKRKMTSSLDNKSKENVQQENNSRVLLIKERNC